MSIHIETDQNSLVIRADSSSLSVDDTATCAKACRDRKRQHALVVFDFSKVRHVPEAALRSLVDTATTLKNEKQQLVVLAHKEFADFIAAANLEPIFQCFIRATASGEITIPPPPIQAGEEVLLFNQIMADAVVQTIEAYGGLTFTAQSPYLIDSGPKPKMDLAGTITILGSGFKGSITLGFPQKTFLGMMSLIKKKEVTRLSPELRNWAAEILNVSFGQLKTTLNGKGYDFRPAIPTIIQGTELEMIHVNTIAAATSLLTSKVGDLYVATSRIGGN